MNKKERQARDFAIPKCECGNNLSLRRQENNINHCPACDYRHACEESYVCRCCGKRHE